MATDHLTIGDISIFFELGLFVALFRFDLQEHYPKLAEWFNRVQTHEVVQQDWMEYTAFLMENVLPKFQIPKEDTFDLYFAPLS